MRLCPVMIRRITLLVLLSLFFAVGISTASKARDTCVTKIIPRAPFVTRVFEIMDNCDEGDDLNVELWQPGYMGLLIVYLCDLKYSVITIPAANGKYIDLICRAEWKSP